MARLDVQRSIDFVAREAQLLMHLMPDAVVLCGFGSPGGHALGCKTIGLPCIILDEQPLATSRAYFGAPANSSPLVTVVRGDALSIAVRDSAVTEHATGNHCVINFDTPPCNPGSTARIKGQRPPSDTHCLGSAIANNQQLLESRGQVWGV